MKASKTQVGTDLDLFIMLWYAGLLVISCKKNYVHVSYKALARLSQSTIILLLGLRNKVKRTEKREAELPTFNHYH